MSEGPYESLNLGILTDDDSTRIERNRELLASAIGRELAWGWQVHGTEIQEWGERPAEPARVDAHVTRRRDLALLVLVADCLPVALAGGDQVAMVHCGWRGLAGGILARAVERFDEPPGAAAVGPGIGRCCFEVGEEVLEQFDPRFADGRMLDLRAVAEDKLRSAGVAHVEHVDLCTSCRPDLFFSHRRDAGVTGRQGGVVWRA